MEFVHGMIYFEDLTSATASRPSAISLRSEDAIDSSLLRVTDEKQCFKVLVSQVGREMGQSDEIVELTLGIDIALTLYLEVHDGMFAHPWWRSIPVPGLFKSIHFDEFDIQISKVEEKIRETEARVRSIYEQATPFEKRHLAVLHQYTVALMNTVTAIRPIVRGLKEKTDNKRYDTSTYNADIAAYKEAEKGYHALGEGMNRSWQAYQRSLIAA